MPTLVSSAARAVATALAAAVSLACTYFLVAKLTLRLDKTLENILPELKPLLDGVDATEDQIGKAIPLVGDLLDLLKKICVG